MALETNGAHIYNWVCLRQCFTWELREIQNKCKLNKCGNREIVHEKQSQRINLHSLIDDLDSKKWLTKCKGGSNVNAWDIMIGQIAHQKAEAANESQCPEFQKKVKMRHHSKITSWVRLTELKSNDMTKSPSDIRYSCSPLWNPCWSPLLELNAVLKYWKESRQRIDSIRKEFWPSH